jgi:hypothetical protein
MITNKTINEISEMHVDISVCEDLLYDIKEALKTKNNSRLELRIHGRPTTRTVPLELGVVCVTAYLADLRAKLMALNEKARAELDAL